MIESFVNHCESFGYLCGVKSLIYSEWKYEAGVLTYFIDSNRFRVYDTGIFEVRGDYAFFNTEKDGGFIFKNSKRIKD